MKMQSGISLVLLAAVGLTACGKNDPRGLPADQSGADDRAKQYEFERELQKFEKEEAKKDKTGKKARDYACRYASSIGAKPPYKRVALTFDDGPTSNGTPYVLDVLKKYGFRATFFMQGGMAKVGPETVRKVADAGDLFIGNHSWDHPNFHTLPFAKQQSEVLRTKKILDQYQEGRFFRYPYGNSTCEANDYVHSLGYKIVGWHIDSCDWAFDKNGTVSAKIGNICGVKPSNRSNFVQHVVDSVKARKGGIILMHDTHLHTIHQLEEIIDELIHEGYTFGSLDEAGFAPSLK